MKILLFLSAFLIQILSQTNKYAKFLEKPEQFDHLIGEQLFKSHDDIHKIIIPEQNNTENQQQNQQNQEKQEEIPHECVHTVKQQAWNKEFQELRKMDKEQRQKQQQKPNKKRNLSSPGPFKSPHDPANNAAPIRITFDVTALHELSSQDIDSQQIDFITAQMDVAKGVYEKRLQVVPVPQPMQLNGYLYPDGQTRYPCGQGFEVPFTRTVPSGPSDFHIYVNAKHEPDRSFLAYAYSCRQEELEYGEQGRPTFAYVHYNTYYLKKFDNAAFAQSMETTLHELAHAFVFSPGEGGLFSYFRDTDGNLRNGKDYSNLLKNIIEKQVVRGLPTDIMVTPEVREWARKHYGCDSLRGLQLENQGASGSLGAHWERTVLYDEIMTASRFGPSKTFSGATLAIFKDSGWYLVNYDQEEKLQWGYKKGCEFLTYDCSDNVSKFEEFCSEHEAVGCSGGREGKGSCFRDANKLANYFMDGNCGIVNPYGNGKCIDIEDSKYDFSYSYSKQTYKYIEKQDEKQYDARCFESTLGGGSVQCYRYECTLYGSIKIKFRESDGSYNEANDAECYYKGQEILNKAGLQGQLVCPDPNTFCKQQRRFCPNWCSKRGYCSNGVCICKKGYGGIDCSVIGVELPSCLTEFDSSKVLALNSEIQCVNKESCCDYVSNPNGCQTYINIFNRKCTSCHPSCNTCLGGDLNQCKTCTSTPDQLYLMENDIGQGIGECIAECPEGYYPDPVDFQCKICTYEAGTQPCKTCKEAGFCRSCHFNIFLSVHDSTEDTQDFKGQCVYNCEGILLDSHSKRCFTGTCPKNRELRNIYECGICNQGNKLFMDTVAGQCVDKDSCPDGTYPDKYEKECMPCHDDCATCFSGTDSGCKSCKLAGSLYLFGNKCISACPSGSHHDDTQKKCAGCNEKCIVCGDETNQKCSECKPGYFYYKDEIALTESCLDSCNFPGTFMDKVYNKCRQCHETCLSCTKETQYHCTSCNPGYTLIPGARSMCVGITDPGCPQGTYHENQVCHKCHHTCTTCNGSEGTACDTCRHRYYKFTNSTTSQNICIFKCPNKYYGGLLDETSEQPICMECDASCLTCKGPSKKQCTKCEKPLYLLNGECVAKCPDILPPDDFNRECFSCIMRFSFVVILLLYLLTW